MPKSTVKEALRAPEEQEALYANLLEKSLPRAVGRRLKPKAVELELLGALPVSQDTQLQWHVDETFAAHRNRRDPKLKLSHEAREARYHDVANLLVLSGMAEPITQDDWKVDRVAEAQDALGLLSFEGLEKMWAEKYAHPDDARTRGTSCRHVQKGPGNGILMYRLRKKKDLVLFEGSTAPSKHGDTWQEIGIGDKLCFTIRDTLKEFIREGQEESPLFRQKLSVLSTAIQRALDKKWFEQEFRNGVPYRKPKGPIDLNVIFSLLAHPEGWLDKTHLVNKTAYLSSKEFDADSSEKLALDAHSWLLSYAGIISDEVDQQLLSRKLSELAVLKRNVKRAIYEKKTDSLQDWRNRFTEITGEVGGQDLGILLQQVQKFIGISRERDSEFMKRFRKDRSRVLDINARLPWILRWAEEAHSKGFHNELSAVIESAIDATGDNNIRNISTFGELIRYIENEMIGHRYASLSEIFDERFMEAVRSHAVYEESDYRKRKVPLDLNREGPKVFLQNFIPMRFSEMRKNMQGLESTVSIFSAVRSDSHETNEDFRNDLVWNCEMLQPGGIIVTDGVLESYTRVSRIREVLKATGGKPDLRAEGIFDAESHELKAVLIQKNHPTKGYLKDEEKRRTWKGSVYFKPLDTVEELRPDLQIGTEIRRQIMAVAQGGDREIFRNLHGPVIAKLHRLLARTAAMKSAVSYGLITQGYVNGVRRRVLAIAQARRDTALGSHLGGDIAVPQRALKEQSYGLLAKSIMSAAGADSVNDDVRSVYERAIFDETASRLYDQFAGENATADPKARDLTKKEREEFRQLMIRVACNADYASPVLKNHDRKEILARLSLDLLPEVRRQKQAQPLVIGRTGLRAFKPDMIYSLSRLSIPPEGVNAPREYKMKKLPSNEEFEDANGVLGEKIDRLQNILLKIHNVDDSKPVILLDFEDCVTNVLLEEKLRKILGKNADHFLQIIPIRFDTKSDGSEIIRHFHDNDTASGDIRRCAESGNKIFIAGGSWFDAYNNHGNLYKATVGKTLLPALHDQNFGNRKIGVCFGYQTAADMIGSSEGMNAVHTQPGALEFGPSGMEILERKHPLFLDCPSNMTVMQTHSGHVAGLDSVGPHAKIRPLAMSTLTRLPIAYTAYDDRVLGMQFHPEIDIVDSDDQEKVLSSMSQGMDRSIHETFGIGVDQLRQMSTRASHHIRANAGKHLLVNALLLHAQGIHGRIKSGGRRGRR